MRDEDSEHILKRRRQLRSRTLSRFRKLLVTGAATGVALGAMTCRASVCLSQPYQFECSQAGANTPVEDVVQLAASWVEETPGNFVVSATVDIDQSGMVQPDVLTFAGAPQLVDAVLLDSTVNAADLSFTCEPGGGTANIEVLIPLGCGSYADAVHVLLDVSATPADGEAIPVTWID